MAGERLPIIGVDPVQTGHELLNSFLRVGHSEDGTFKILSADPIAPLNGSAWFVASGTSPNRVINLKIKDQGTIYTIQLMQY